MVQGQWSYMLPVYTHGSLDHIGWVVYKDRGNTLVGFTPDEGEAERLVDKYAVRPGHDWSKP